jgi:pectin methylesterase-like acyl-CoA thioesterase
MNKMLQTSFIKSWLSLCLAFLSFAGAHAQHNVVVAKDGSGDFTTIQEAINAAPAGRTTPYVIFIKNGKYKEVVTIPSSKPFLQLMGESVAGTIITYDNYSGKLIPGGGGATYGTNNCATVFLNANDCALFNLSVENSTGYTGDGPQAVAVYITGDRVVFKNCRLNSGQDTLWHNGSGKQYFKNCYIDGNTDFIFGSSTAVFDDCIIYGRDRVDGGGGGYITAANTPAGQTYGEVFRDCQVPRNRGVTSYSLGRPWQNEPKTVYLNTRMSSSVQPTGWSTWNVNSSVITYAEYKSKYYNGTPIDVSQRLSWSKQLTDAEAAAYYNNANLFGAWDPCAVWAGLCAAAAPEIAVSNFRTQRGGSNSTISWNMSWPIAGVTFDLYRSSDSVNWTKINTSVAATDTAVAFSVTDALPQAGSKCFYYLQASKAGLVTHTTDVAVVNVAIPLNGEYRSATSGPWANGIVGTTAISSGAVSSVTIAASPGGFTSAPAVTFSAAPSGGTTATGTAIVSNGMVTGVNITNPGSGYTSAPSLTWNYSGAGGQPIWETYSSATSTWNPVAWGTGPSNVNVTVQTGHTLTLTALVGINSLTIQQGAVLQTDAQGKNLRIKGDLTNAGVFGGSGTSVNKITLELDGTNGVYNISGDGVYNFSGIRFLTAVSNITLNIQSNLVLSGGLQAWYGSNNSTWDYGTNDVTINIKPGVTVQAGFMHSSSSSDFVVKTVGKYTYNISGTLDLSNSTTLTALMPHKTIAQPITLNVTGLLKLGTQFVTNVSPTAGSLHLAIGDGGLVDASKTTNFNLGSNSFVLSGSGALRRRVGSTAVIFAVSAVPGISNTVTLTNSGTPDNFSVSVKPTFDHAVPSANKVVNRQWDIQEEVGGGSNATVSLAWTAADQAAGFDPASGISILHYNGAAWNQLPASVSGAGTSANPYVATTTGVTSFSPFAVSNNSNALPLQLLSFTASHDVSGVLARWVTSNETAVALFEVERSLDGRFFTAIGQVAARNYTGQNNYTYFDAFPVEGVVCYRLKMIDQNGRAKYSSVVVINTRLKGAIALYPNPAGSVLTITHKKATVNAMLTVIGPDGRIVQSKKPGEGTTQTSIDIAMLAPGVYTILVNNIEQSVKQFIKQ